MWKYNYARESYLCHYGIKGMRWGVRRTKENLKYDRGSIESTLKKNTLKTVTKNGILITGTAKHALDRADGKDRAVTAKDIIDALKNPSHINDVKTDKRGLRSQRFIGKDATANVNPDTGVIVTVWKTGSDKKLKYLKKEE